jgi:hypothetical protein
VAINVLFSLFPCPCRILWFSIRLFFMWGFETLAFYGMGLSAACPTHQPGGPGYPSLSGISLETCPALPAATLPPAQLSSSLMHASPLTQHQGAFNKVEIPSRGHSLLMM